MTTQEFQKTVDAQTEKTRQVELSSIMDELEAKIAEIGGKAKEIGLSVDECTSVRSRLIAAAEHRWMLTRYASLDTSFAERNLYYVLTRDEKNPSEVRLKGLLNGTGLDDDSEAEASKKTEKIVLLPEFVTVWDSYEDWRDRYEREERWTRDNWSANGRNGYELPPVRVGGEHYGRTRVYVTTKYPDGITDPMFKRMRKALAFSRMFDVNLLDRDITDPRREGASDSFGLLWCPKPEAWSVTKTPPRPDGDPAILFKTGGKTYLVGYFDTPDERPIDDMIREFSEGELPRKGKK